MDDVRFDRRALIKVVVAALVGAALAVGASYALLAQSPPQYRAEAQVALLPGPRVPPEKIADYWDALSRGQAGRIAAEVLSQRRWEDPAARAGGVPQSSIQVSAGVIADTSLINVDVVADSPQAAEVAVAAVIREATPVVEQVSGPFTLQIVQSADGSGTHVGAPATQVYAVAGGAGVLIGGGLALALVRRRRIGINRVARRGADEHYLEDYLLPAEVPADVPVDVVVGPAASQPAPVPHVPPGPARIETTVRIQRRPNGAVAVGVSNGADRNGGPDRKRGAVAGRHSNGSSPHPGAKGPSPHPRSRPDLDEGPERRRTQT